MKKQVVITSVPYTSTTSPMMAPALLKSVVEEAGFTCAGIDINGWVFKEIVDSPDYSNYLTFFYYEEIKEGFEDKIYKLFDTMATRILDYDPEFVCLSLLHFQCQVSCRWLAFMLKKRKPSVKIIIGGAGCFGSGLLEYLDSFPEALKKQGFIDFYISGDGDISLPELIKGNISYSGINNPHWTPIEDLNVFPYPNYDDYDWSIYRSPFLGVLGSRGCVRDCTFCDIHEYWEKFKFRTGQDIFDEMYSQNQRYGTRFFKFQDSLINGNVKEYNKLIRLLADYNNKNPENSFSWASYFIFRPAGQMSEEMWRLTAESGAFLLNVGIESLVDRNRHHMRKKFSNEDIEHSLHMAQKYGVNIFFLILVGYVTETEQDHQDTLQWLRDNQHYANDPIIKISIGGTLSLNPNTWIHRNQKELGVTWKDGDPSRMSGPNQLWEIKETGNDYETRLRRLSDLIKVGTELGFAIHQATIDPQKELENLIKKEIYENVSRDHI